MKQIMLFHEKEHCLDYYRKLSPGKSERSLIRSHLLYKKYPYWFEFPEFTEEEKKELDEWRKSEEKITPKQKEPFPSQF